MQPDKYIKCFILLEVMDCFEFNQDQVNAGYAGNFTIHKRQYL